MEVPALIFDLVERFERNITAYRSGQYKETQLRHEFIDPFFTALGWDVNNEQGYAEAYKDVIHEDAIKVGGATEAPDYCFRIGGTRKFFLEAKRPSVNIKDDVDSAYQLRRYAWSSKLPLSILTDFEEFAVYDCRIKPSSNDSASKARVLYIQYREYPERWEEIAAIFSRDAILKGSFDKYAASNKTKKGTTEVDSAFLEEIESWRDLLARSIAIRNPRISQRDLNFAVQRTIDRIIFLRICEDRGIEIYGQLMTLLNGARVYERLCQIFHHADEKYNSGLFHFRHEKERSEPPDELTPNLTVSDPPLKLIIKSLYYPESPYEFSVLPADILGQIYEQFLGKIIRLTSAHRAVVDYKPAVKKAGGVYYTPTYIVDYIVKSTVGKLLDGKTTRTAAKIKILDPACGSGSFLIGAYQYLLDWYRDQYIDGGPEMHAKGRHPRLYQSSGGAWKLTTTERKRILLNNIYGVDIDQQAVEVTKLSLLLKVLEGENAQTIESMLKLFHERALPDLGNNIKCGNSLIGSDFYEREQLNMLDDEERYRINVFDWDREFEGIMKEGGFDVVIGNPPYVQILYSEHMNELEYYANHYVATSAFKKNLFPIFIERSLDLIKCKDGRFSMIIPDRFFFTPSYIPCRKRILESSKVEGIREILAGAFEKAIVGNAVFIVSTPCEDSYEINIEQWNNNEVTLINQLSLKSVLSDPEVVINLLMTRHAAHILQNCQGVSVPLKNIISAHVGIMIKDNKTLFTESQISKKQKKIVKGRQLKRYKLTNTYFFDSDSAVVFGGTKSPQKHEQSPKILMRKTGDKLVAYLDTIGIYAEQSVYLLLPKSDTNLLFVLGILNCSLMQYLFQNCFITNPIAYPYIQHYDLEKLPIRKIDFSDSTDKSRHDQIVKLVESMLSLNKQLSDANTSHEKTVIQRQIDSTDKRIDRLVYELYDLTDEEIMIVEQAK